MARLKCDVCLTNIVGNAYASCDGCGGIMHTGPRSTCGLCRNELFHQYQCCTACLLVPGCEAWNNIVDHYVCRDCLQGDL